MTPTEESPLAWPSEGTAQGSPDDSAESPVPCHACNAAIEGAPAGHGLLMFLRGDEVVYEEPPLCERCALAISMTALYRWEIEEEEG